MTFTKKFFVEKGAEGAKKRNANHSPSEITKRGWDTRRKNLDKAQSTGVISK